MNCGFRMDQYHTSVCKDCPFDPDDPNNQSYVDYGPHNLTQCIKAESTCPEGLIRVNGNSTADRR